MYVVMEQFTCAGFKKIILYPWTYWFYLWIEYEMPDGLMCLNMWFLTGGAVLYVFPVMMDCFHSEMYTYITPFFFKLLLVTVVYPNSRINNN